MWGLFPRFYDASSGTIRVDGRNVNSYSLEELREKVHVVLQRAVLFRGTLREKTCFGAIKMPTTKRCRQP